MTNDRLLEALRYLPLPLIFLIFFFQLRRIRLHPRPEDARVIRWIGWLEVVGVVYVVFAMIRR